MPETGRGSVWEATYSRLRIRDTREYNCLDGMPSDSSRPLGIDGMKSAIVSGTRETAATLEARFKNQFPVVIWEIGHCHDALASIEVLGNAPGSHLWSGARLLSSFQIPSSPVIPDSALRSRGGRVFAEVVGTVV